jgi:apolipoprotein N-acyltransferase
MLVLAWDFQDDRSWHGHIAIMRGVEDGFSGALGEEWISDGE